MFVRILAVLLIAAVAEAQATRRCCDPCVTTDAAPFHVEGPTWLKGRTFVGNVPPSANYDNEILMKLGGDLEKPDVQGNASADDAIGLYVGAAMQPVANIARLSAIQADFGVKDDGHGRTVATGAALRVFGYYKSGNVTVSRMYGLLINEPRIGQHNYGARINGRVGIDGDPAEGTYLHVFGNGVVEGDLAITGTVTAQGQRYVAGTLTISNDGGTLRHAWSMDARTRVASSHLGPLNGANPAPAATPACRASFANAGCVDAAAFVIDTPLDQTPGSAVLHPTLAANSTGTAVLVDSYVGSIDAGGKAMNRPVLVFTHATTGAPFRLDAATIPNGKALSVKFTGYMR